MRTQCSRSHTGHTDQVSRTAWFGNEPGPWGDDPECVTGLIASPQQRLAYWWNDWREHCVIHELHSDAFKKVPENGMCNVSYSRSLEVDSLRLCGGAAWISFLSLLSAIPSAQFPSLWSLLGVPATTLLCRCEGGARQEGEEWHLFQQAWPRVSHTGLPLTLQWQVLTLNWKWGNEM